LYADGKQTYQNNCAEYIRKVKLPSSNCIWNNYCLWFERVGYSHLACE